jgi:predicted kinase
MIACLDRNDGGGTVAVPGGGAGPERFNPGPGALRTDDMRSLDPELLDYDTVNKARLMLTCGLPGAGKTKLATGLAADRRAVRLTKDEWLWALGSTPWDEPTRERIEHELWRLAQEILHLGVSVVLDFGLWARDERDEMRTAARGLGVGVELHYLEVPADELWQRIEARNSEPPWDSHPIRRADLEGWMAVFQAPDAVELALFDAPSTPN